MGQKHWGRNTGQKHGGGGGCEAWGRMLSHSASASLLYQTTMLHARILLRGPTLQMLLSLHIRRQIPGIWQGLSSNAPLEESELPQYTSDKRFLGRHVLFTVVNSGGLTWHTGGTDPNSPEHLTVEYKDSRGQHVTTKHIDRNGYAC